MDKETTQRYYDYTVNFYKVFWHGETRALHYGIWDQDTTTLHEALLNTNQKMAEAVGIQGKEHVLDAGCGVGGSLLWLKEQYDVTGEGVTISQKQIEKAEELTIRKGYQKDLHFSEQDFTKTNFKDETFDIVWATESVCHAIVKRDFLKEAYRILKPGGRLVVADGFLEREPSNEKEKREFKNFLDGLALDNLSYSKEFLNQIKEVGFREVVVQDYTAAVMPTAKRMKVMCTLGWYFARITTFLGLTPRLIVDNNRAGIDQYYLTRDGVTSYRIFSAKKNI